MGRVVAFFSVVQAAIWDSRRAVFNLETPLGGNRRRRRWRDCGGGRVGPCRRGGYPFGLSQESDRDVSLLFVGHGAYDQLAFPGFYALFLFP